MLGVPGKTPANTAWNRRKERAAHANRWAASPEGETMLDKQFRGLWMVVCDGEGCKATYEPRGYDCNPNKNFVIARARKRGWMIGKKAQLCPACKKAAQQARAADVCPETGGKHHWEPDGSAPHECCSECGTRR